MNTVDFIKQNEGYRKHPYKCTAGKTTIAYGRNLEDVGISRAEAEVLLRNDIADALHDLLRIFPDFQFLPKDVCTALTDMRFNLGPGGFRKFKKMIEAVKLNDFKKAADEAKDSRWYKQVPNRAKRVCGLLAGDGFI